MLKKKIVPLFLTLAYALLLGHNIIPHHHHATEQELAQHHQTDHHHGDEDGNNLSHILSHFHHPADGFTTLNNHSTSNTFFKRLPWTVAVLSESYSFDEAFIPPLLHKPSAKHPVYRSPHSLPSGLRAPPIVLA